MFKLNQLGVLFWYKFRAINKIFSRELVTRRQQTFFEKGQNISIFGLVGQVANSKIIYMGYSTHKQQIKQNKKQNFQFNFKIILW